MPVIAAQPTLFVFYLSDGMKKETEFLLAEILTFRKESARERMTPCHEKDRELHKFGAILTLPVLIATDTVRPNMPILMEKHNKTSKEGKSAAGVHDF